MLYCIFLMFVLYLQCVCETIFFLVHVIYLNMQWHRKICSLKARRGANFMLTLKDIYILVPSVSFCDGTAALLPPLILMPLIYVCMFLKIYLCVCMQFSGSHWINIFNTALNLSKCVHTLSFRLARCTQQ